MRLAAVAALAGAVALVGSAAQATTVVDGSGILSTFVGKNEDHPDLNALSASATFDSSNAYLNATMAGAIGFTAANSGGDQQGVYVWGVNRGKGTAVLNGPNNLGTDTSTPVGGPDIKFDAFIVLQNLANGHGDGFVALIGDDGKVAGTPFGLDATNISYSGNTISLTVPLSDLPTNGFAIPDYGYNIWPRLNGLASNTLVASFLPGDHNFLGSAVPEPASWAMMIVGFGMLGSTLRRRWILAA
jgi:hypothetical protein